MNTGGKIAIEKIPQNPFLNTPETFFPYRITPLLKSSWATSVPSDTDGFSETGSSGLGSSFVEVASVAVTKETSVSDISSVITF